MGPMTPTTRPRLLDWLLWRQSQLSPWIGRAEKWLWLGRIVEPPRGFEPRTYALRAHSDVLTTRAVLGLTRPNALDRSRPLLGCFGDLADLVRTRLSESSRISPRIKSRSPVRGTDRVDAEGHRPRHSETCHRPMSWLYGWQYGT
jgi:hypothetical protein